MVFIDSIINTRRRGGKIVYTKKKENDDDRVKGNGYPFNQKVLKSRFMLIIFAIFFFYVLIHTN